MHGKSTHAVALIPAARGITPHASYVLVEITGSLCKPLDFSQGPLELVGVNSWALDGCVYVDLVFSECECPPHEGSAFECTVSLPHYARTAWPTTIRLERIQRFS